MIKNNKHKNGIGYVYIITYNKYNWLKKEITQQTRSFSLIEVGEVNYALRILPDVINERHSNILI